MHGKKDPKRQEKGENGLVETKEIKLVESYCPYLNLKHQPKTLLLLPPKRGSTEARGSKVAGKKKIALFYYAFRPFRVVLLRKEGSSPPTSLA